MSSEKIKRKKRLKLVFIYVRYILPILFCVLMISSTFIPCLQFSTTDGTNEPISSSELFVSSWNTVRNYLFSGEETKPEQESFAKILLVSLIVMTVLFVIGSLSAVIVAIFAIRYIAAPDSGDDIPRMWFISIVPNRIVSGILYSLTLPLLFLSRIIIPLFDGMNIDVLLKVKAPEPWVFGLVGLALTVILSIITSYWEKDMGIDVFKRRKAKVTVIERKDLPKAEEKTRELDEETERYKKEQAERIRALFGDNDNKDNG